jgi:hypothetical protein
MEMKKELDPKCRQIKNIDNAEKALTVILTELPDNMTEDQVNISTQIFAEMEKLILLLDIPEYFEFMSPLEREQLYEMFNPDISNCGTEY